MTYDNTKKLTVQARDIFTIPVEATVKASIQGERFAEVLYMEKDPHKPAIEKIDKDTYRLLSTGEEKKFEHHDKKGMDALRKTFSELRGIIRANFDGDNDNQCFLTLTYAENMTDADKLQKDFDKFWKRLKYDMPEHKLDYVAVAEPQARGAWHMHVMIKSDQPVLFIDNKLLTTFQPHPRLKDRLYKDPVSKKPVITGGIWGHGYTSCERLKGDDRGKYYEAYFTSLEVDDVKIVCAKNGKKSKRYKKGARLPMYPVHFKLYRCSRGIVRPSNVEADYGLIVEKYGKPYNTFAYQLRNSEGRVLNNVQRESFKKPKPD